jgi:hypothetical protein
MQYTPCMVAGEKAPLQVRLEPELRSRFKVVCAKQDRSMSDVLVEFIAWYTKKKEEEQ